METKSLSREEYVALLEKHKIFQFGEFTLRSGILSPIYIELRRLISMPTILTSTADLVIEMIKKDGIKFDYLCGVPYGALPLATLISVRMNVPMLMLRKENTERRKRPIEGDFEEGKTVLIIEDVVVAGGSIATTLDALRKHGLVCSDAVCVADREQGGVQYLESKESVKLHKLITMSDILQYLEKTQRISATQKVEIWDALKNPKMSSKI